SDANARAGKSEQGRRNEAPPLLVAPPALVAPPVVVSLPLLVARRLLGRPRRRPDAPAARLAAPRATRGRRLRALRWAAVVRSLYLHVPFCPSICPYCDFHKMRRHEGLVARYLDRLEEEAAALAARHPGPLDTVYLGGGTPSHLTDGELARVFALLARSWGTPARLETTLEADPRTFDRERLARFRDHGVDRLSIGLQST